MLGHAERLKDHDVIVLHQNEEEIDKQEKS